MFGCTNRWAVPFREEGKAGCWRFGFFTAAALLAVSVSVLLSGCGSASPPANSPTPSASGGAPATAGPQLPMTVTANGVAVELQWVDSTSTATRFSFMIQGSPGQLNRNQGFPTILGSNPADDVTIDGMTLAPNDPYVAPKLGVGNNPNIGFTLDYQSPFPPQKTVTITIKHLTLPAGDATPVSNQAPSSQPVEGPWTFTITSAAMANQPMPAPSGGIDRFAGVSATQAQEWSSFPITAPNPLPTVLSQDQVLKRNEFNVNGYSLGVPETAPANYVLFTYDQPLGQVVFLAETTNDDAVPNISGDSATLLMPDEPSGKTGTWAISRGTLSHPMFDGVIITRFEVSTLAGNGPMFVYVWKLGAVDYLIWHMTDTSPSGIATVTDDDLQQMVTSIIKQLGGDTIPAPSGAVTPTRQATLAASTPTSLPQTASASGLRITLASANLDGSQIVLTFKIESADPNQPNMWDVGGGAEFAGILPPENDIVATGLKWDDQNQVAQEITPLVPPGFKPPPPAPSPTPQPTPDIVGYQMTLPFLLTVPADQPVTVTIRRFRFEHGPSSPPPGKIISGTWSFAFVPASLPSPSPTSTSISAP